MDNVEWHPFFYNGLETNIEVTRCGRVRRVPKDWIKYKFYKHTYEVDFANLVKSNGYIVLGVNIKNYKPRALAVHQMVASVFLNHTINGYSLVVDHIDSDRTNNHVDNLKLVTNRENSSKEVTIKSGLPTGVTYNKKYKKYSVFITIKKSNRYLGWYSNVEEASEVYQHVLKELNQFLKDTDYKGDQNEWFILYCEKNKIKKRLKVHSLPRGVSFVPITKSFRAKISINNHTILLGNYKRSEDAHKAYKEAKSSLDRWLSENKDPNDWIIEYRKKIKAEAEYRRKLNKSIKSTEKLPLYKSNKEPKSNIGEQLPIHFN
jgi:hypothetical protein